MSAFRLSPILKPSILAGLGLALTVGLSGCSGLRQAMGIDKVSPDEFAIVTKAPLVIPPDYNLRPPRPGAPRAATFSPQMEAHEALFGEGSSPVADGIVTSGELAILQGTGAGEADPTIREVLAADLGNVVQKDRGFTDRILFWGGGNAGDDASVVDAAAEDDRIRNNQATGRPVTTGETPTISKDRGIF